MFRRPSRLEDNTNLFAAVQVVEPSLPGDAYLLHADAEIEAFVFGLGTQFVTIGIPAGSADPQTGRLVAWDRWTDLRPVLWYVAWDRKSEPLEFFTGYLDKFGGDIYDYWDSFHKTVT